MDWHVSETPVSVRIAMRVVPGEHGRIVPVKEFLKTIIIGGVMFLLPVAVVLFVLSYALRLVKTVATPISNSLHLDQLGGIAGIGATTVLSVLVLILTLLRCGHCSTHSRRQAHYSLVGEFSSRPFSAHQLIKSMAEGFAHIQSASGLKPALISIEDGWQIGYLLEALENDWVAVFLPQAPTPMSGNIMYFPAKTGAAPRHHNG